MDNTKKYITSFEDIKISFRNKPTEENKAYLLGLTKGVILVATHDFKADFDKVIEESGKVIEFLETWATL